MKKSVHYTMTEKVYLYPGESAVWHFVQITKKFGLEIKEKFGKNRRGFGSISVEVTLGKTIWKTSIFPDKYSGSYILPLKASVRKAEGIQDGEKIKFSIRVNI